MRTHIDEYAAWLQAALPDIPGEVIWALAEEALVQPKGRVLCACNRTWMPLRTAERTPMRIVHGHGFDDCR